MAGASSSKKRSRRRRKRNPNPATQLTDDLLVEILSRVPYRSLCRFRPFPANGHCFTDVSGTGSPLVDSSFLFVPDYERKHLRLEASCNGLLLGFTFRDEFVYLVLNPTTVKWVAVPVAWRWESDVQRILTACFAFDPAFSDHFYIFVFQLDYDHDDDYGWNDRVLGVNIYSSETGLWCYKQSGWSFGIQPRFNFKSVFVNGVLYVTATECVIGAVDVKGDTWKTIDFPCRQDLPFHDTGAGFIDLSQGRLHFANNDMERDKLAIWVLDDKDSNE